jgi:hypothetical protein
VDPRLRGGDDHRGFHPHGQSRGPCTFEMTSALEMAYHARGSLGKN